MSQEMNLRCIQDEELQNDVSISPLCTTSKHDATVLNVTHDDIIGVVRDVTEGEWKVRDVGQEQAVPAKLYQVGDENGFTFKQRARSIFATGYRYLDLLSEFLTRREEDRQEMVHTVGEHNRLKPDGSAPIEQSYCLETVYPYSYT